MSGVVVVESGLAVEGPTESSGLVVDGASELLRLVVHDKVVNAGILVA